MTIRLKELVGDGLPRSHNNGAAHCLYSFGGAFVPRDDGRASHFDLIFPDLCQLISTFEEVEGPYTYCRPAAGNRRLS